MKIVHSRESNKMRSSVTYGEKFMVAPGVTAGANFVVYSSLFRVVS